MADVLLRRRDLTLSPADGLAEHEMERLPLGRDILCTLKRTRSASHNRLYWACLHRVAQNLDQEISAKALHKWLLLRVGWATPIALRSGKIEWVPDSTSFDKMDQAEFNIYSKAAFEMIEVGFGISPESVKREGRELLGGFSR